MHNNDDKESPPGSSTDANNRRGPWSPEEDRQLLELVSVFGPSNWVRISNSLATRTPKQCRERYHQNLKPSLNRSPITAEEGALIESLVAKHGKKWAEIARHLNGRSDNAVKNWWNGGASRRRRQSTQEGQTFLVGQENHNQEPNQNHPNQNQNQNQYPANSNLMSIPEPSPEPSPERPTNASSSPAPYFPTPYFPATHCPAAIAAPPTIAAFASIFRRSQIPILNPSVSVAVSASQRTPYCLQHPNVWTSFQLPSRLYWPPGSVCQTAQFPPGFVRPGKLQNRLSPAYNPPFKATSFGRQSKTPFHHRCSRRFVFTRSSIHLSQWHHSALPFTTSS